MTFRHLATRFSCLANSPLVGQITFKQGSNARMTTTKKYDYLNRLMGISSSSSSSFSSSFNYNYKTANQRTRNALADGSYWFYEHCAVLATNGPTVGHQHDRKLKQIRHGLERLEGEERP